MSEPRWPALTVARLSRRDPLRCLHCGTTIDLTVQHRAVKGSGGRRSAERPSNGCLLCLGLNVAAESNAGAAELCIRYGWKISTHADPATVPVYDATEAAWYLLGDALDPSARVRVA